MLTAEEIDRIKSAALWAGIKDTEAAGKKTNGTGTPLSNNVPANLQERTKPMEGVAVFDVPKHLALIQKQIAEASLHVTGAPAIPDMAPVVSAFQNESSSGAGKVSPVGARNPLQGGGVNPTRDAQAGLLSAAHEGMTRARHFVVFNTMEAVQSQFYGEGHTARGAALDVAVTGAAVNGLVAGLERQGFSVLIAKSGEGFAKINDLINQNGGKWAGELRDLVDGSPLTKARELAVKGDLSYKLNSLMADAPPLVKSSMESIKDICEKNKVHLSSDEIQGFFKKHSAKMATALTLSPHADQIAHIASMSDDGVKGLFKLATDAKFRSAVGELSLGVGDSVAMLPGGISKGVGSSLVVAGHLLSSDDAKESLAPHLLRMGLTIGAGIGLAAAAGVVVPLAAGALGVAAASAGTVAAATTATAWIAGVVGGEIGAKVSDYISKETGLAENFHNTSKEKLADAVKVIGNDFAKGSPDIQRGLSQVAEAAGRNPDTVAQFKENIGQAELERGARIKLS